jgi:hypothetical protein
MTFIDADLAANVGRIVLVTLVKTTVLEMVKGRLERYDGTSMTLVGDDEVAKKGVGPDDTSQSFYTVTRLGPGQSRTIRFVDVAEWAWQA